MNEEKFLKEIENHVMEVIRDDGLYRHIRFREPGTMMQHFDLITWPGYLCYCGDMGTYVFSRLDDMFKFFRSDRKWAQENGRQLGINLSYWSEKLDAVDGTRRNGSAKEYSPEQFSQIVKEKLVYWMRDYGLDRSERRELRESVEDEVLNCADEGDVRAYDAANGFSVTIGGHTFEFQDFWEHDLTVYTHRFIWCCYALAWGVQVYDESKEAVEV